MSSQTMLGKNSAKFQQLRKPNSWKWCIFASSHQNRNLSQSKRLLYNSRWAQNHKLKHEGKFHAVLNLKSFAKGRTWRIETEIVKVLLAQLKISVIVLGNSKNNVGKTIGRKLGINSSQKTFWKKLQFHKIDIELFEFKHPNITGKRYCLLNRIRTTQWQQSRVSFTLAASKVFWKSHSVANSYQKCVSGFLTEVVFIVQMFINPMSSCKTVKGSLQIPQSFKKYLRSLKQHQERWL